KYYEHPYFSYEWNDGVLEEVPVSDREGFLQYKWFLTLADNFLTVFPEGELFGLEIGFRLRLPRKTSIRKPDLAVVLNSNPAVFRLRDRTYSGTADICIEVVSDSSAEQVRRDTVVKKLEYDIIGVGEYYILDPKGNETAFFRRGRAGRYVKIKPAKGGIIKSGILPGFQFRISDLYSRPSLENMSGDAVYSKFALPFYQAEKQRAEREEQRAEREEQRAEQEKQRAEQEKQRAEQLEKQLHLETQRAEQEAQRAEQEAQRAEQEAQRAEQEKQRAERLAEKLKSLGISADE
ncbi:MAG: Uma2 family endonuclease, partial [Desulfobacteraceae bacterium]|nr:Uma2 family endonuclease [Desulfobacteraceae bacterium]